MSKIKEFNIKLILYRKLLMKSSLYHTVKSTFHYCHSICTQSNQKGFITPISFLFSFQVRNATAAFIINLSLSDLLFCCFNLPLAASTFWNRDWMHSHLLCRLFPLLRYGLLAVSLFTVLAITINRYIMIGHPRIYPRWVLLSSTCSGCYMCRSVLLSDARQLAVE